MSVALQENVDNDTDNEDVEENVKNGEEVNNAIFYGDDAVFDSMAQGANSS